MIQTLIVDDEPLNLDELKYLRSFHNDINISAEASSVNQAIQQLSDRQFDLIFLDIQMHEKHSGFTLAKIISQLEKQPLIIFVTAYSQHAVPAYDFQPLHYILKPVVEDKLNLALQRARKMLDDSKQGLTTCDLQKMLSAVGSLKPAKKITIKYKSQDSEANTIYPTVYLYACDGLKTVNFSTRTRV